MSLFNTIIPQMITAVSQNDLKILQDFYGTTVFYMGIRRYTNIICTNNIFQNEPVEVSYPI
ncbi:MAG: hypothetical protein GY805_04480 [Chloroflexi bacterium]|nr:hypothetical protein [Chloroflexota bacterium]